MIFPGFTPVTNPARTHPYRLAGQVPFRFVFHTDEVPGADIWHLARTHPNPPHFWVDPSRKVAIQIIDTDLSARALHRPKGSPLETNHACAIQTEMAGRASATDQWPIEWLDWLAAKFAPVVRHHNIDPTVALPTYGSNDAYGTGARSRMTEAAWLGFNGLCAHQHVPTNDHWDAGRLDLAHISAEMTRILTPHTPDPPPEDDMTPDEARALFDEYIGRGDRPIRTPIGETNRTLPAHTDLLAQLSDRLRRIEDALGITDPNGAYPKRTLKRLIKHDEES